MNMLKSYTAMFVLTMAHNAQAATFIDYRPEAFSQPSFSKGGVTITGSADVFSGVGGTVGIVGLAGIFNDSTVDRADSFGVMETITFSFDSGAATDINLFVSSGVLGTPNILIEAFAPGGTSLGSTSVIVLGSLPVNSLFSNNPIESFQLSNTLNDKGFSLGSIEYSVVPIPAAAWLFGSALLGLVGVARRKQA